MVPIVCSEDELRAAFAAHKDGQSKFTRRMAIHIANFAGVSPMSVVWRLEKMGLLKRGSWDWFKANGGITKSHINEVMSGGVSGMADVIAVGSVSGGKDSTAAALKMLDAHDRENCRLVMFDTGNEHPITIDYMTDYFPKRFNMPVEVLRADFSKDIARKRIYVAEKWPEKGVPADLVARTLGALHPTGNPFLDLCMMKGRFPSRMAQFCTQELKRRPADAYMASLMAEGVAVESWRGIRRDESENRKDAKAEEWAAEGWKIVHPIVDWTAQQTVDFVLSRGVELNPLYKMGMGRVGCMPCINCGKDELLEIAHRFPEHIDRIREWEAIVAECSKLTFATFFATDAERSPVARDGWTYSPIEQTDEIGNIEMVDSWLEPDADIFERGRIDNRVEWAKTKRGGKQYDLERFMPRAACSSSYGLCE